MGCGSAGDFGTRAQPSGVLLLIEVLLGVGCWLRTAVLRRLMGVAALDVRCGIDWRDHAATSALWSGEAHTGPLRNADHDHAVAVGTAAITCLDSVPSCTTRNSSTYSFVDKTWRRCKQRQDRLST